MHVTCYVPLRYLADFKADWRFGEGQGSDRVFADHNLSQLVSIDFFTVPTIRFQVLYVFLVLAHDRRRILHFNVTPYPTAQWTGSVLRSRSALSSLVHHAGGA